MTRVSLLIAFALSGVVQFHGQELSTPLPVDPQVRIGSFENGLRYYLRKNSKPEKRAELRLAVNVGSIVEDDDQLGLAHFVEHMAFNGTTKYPKQTLVNLLQSIGMQFGPDVNAYTDFDETVYMLQVPTDNDSILEQGISVLEEWSRHIAFDSTEVEKERGVVIEEWRIGRGANMRMTEKQFPVLLRGSKYADRLPIGKKSTLESFDLSTIKRFYRDWYRPDLMAVMVVGDIDLDRTQSILQEYLARVPRSASPRERGTFPVQNHTERRYALATDPEATSSSAALYYQLPPRHETTVADYRHSIVEALSSGMLNDRLEELTKKAEPPFLYGYSGRWPFVRTTDFYILTAGVESNGIERGLGTVLTEAIRVQQHGFLESELSRQKIKIMRSMEQAYQERDKTESSTLIDEYVRHFLTDEPIPGIEYEYSLYRKFAPGITLAEVNSVATSHMTDSNLVVVVNHPEKDGIRTVTATAMDSVLRTVLGLSIEPYAEDVSTEPLVPLLPPAGTVSSTARVETFNISEWKLSNGIRIIAKSTDFKNDQVLFSAFSPGGASLEGDKDHVSATTSSWLVEESGLGEFDKVKLEKKLAGKLVDVSSFVSEYEEGLNGSASSVDLEAAFQLIYLHFTAPRFDSSAFLAVRSRMKGYLQNRSASPEAAFEDTVQATMTSHHWRRRPFSLDLLREMDLHRSKDIFRGRFFDASDFTFVFVGSFNPDTLKSLAIRYLGGLPARGKTEKWKDVGIRPPRGVVSKVVRKGIEPKSQVRMVFTGPFSYSYPNRVALQNLVQVMRDRYREALREEKGGTYGVGVGANQFDRPVSSYSLMISFGCPPERVDELTEAALDIIDSLKTVGPTDEVIDQVREIRLREREVQLKENEFWLGALQGFYSRGEDIRLLNEFPAIMNSMTKETIRNAAREYLNTLNYARFVLHPQQ